MGGDLSLIYVGEFLDDASRQRFDDAVAALRFNGRGPTRASRWWPMATYAGEVGSYFARPQNFASLRLFREPGVELLAEPEGEPGDQTTDFAGVTSTTPSALSSPASTRRTCSCWATTWA